MKFFMRHHKLWLGLAALLALFGCANPKAWRQQDDKTILGFESNPDYDRGRLPDDF
jgi:hypothetical protein